MKTLLISLVFLFGCSQGSKSNSDLDFSHLGHNSGPGHCPVNIEQLEICVEFGLKNVPTQKFSEQGVKIDGVVHEIVAGCLLSGGLNPQSILEDKSGNCKTALEALKNKYIKKLNNQ